MTNSDKNWTTGLRSISQDAKNETHPKAATQSDVQLWGAFKDGNESAFITIYNTYFPMLYRYGFQYTKDKALIKDAIQDLFVELRQKRKRLSHTTSIKLYLYKSIRRKILGHKEKAINKMMSNQTLDGYDLKWFFL
ncbi:MAG: sigma-70 family RNA polymerase sigma factor [Cyclobacteriaceae bacterium]